VRLLFNVRLGEAKVLVGSSPEYHPQAAAMDPIHEEMINALREEGDLVEHEDGSFEIVIDLQKDTRQEWHEIKKLSVNDEEIVLQAMRYIMNDPAFDNGELHTRLGIRRVEMQTVIDQWPDIDYTEYGSIAQLAANNSLNEICHGLFISSHKWSIGFTVSPESVREVFARLQEVSRNNQ